MSHDIRAQHALFLLEDHGPEKWHQLRVRATPTDVEHPFREHQQRDVHLLPAFKQSCQFYNYTQGTVLESKRIY